MKIKVQAQHLQPGDIVGSGEVVEAVIRDSINMPKGKCYVKLNMRGCHWGKYTMINVERADNG